MTTNHPYDKTSRIPSLRLDVQVSNPISGSPVPERAAVDTGASLTKIPMHLKSKLGSLRKISETPIAYGNDAVEKHSTYLAKIHLNGFVLDAEVYFREAKFILLGRNVLNQLRLTADGKSLLFTFEDP